MCSNLGQISMEGSSREGGDNSRQLAVALSNTVPLNFLNASSERYQPSNACVFLSNISVESHESSWYLWKNLDNIEFGNLGVRWMRLPRNLGQYLIVNSKQDEHAADGMCTSATSRCICLFVCEDFGNGKE